MNKCVLPASGSGHPVVCWLLTAAEMKRCDSNTSEIFGVPSVVLMERAALSCVDVIVSRQKKLEELSGVKQPVIARTENGTSCPNIETLLKLLEPMGKKIIIVDD